MSDLIIIPGQTERFTAAFKNADGSAINLTGSTVTLEARRNDLVMAVTVTNAAAGQVAVVIDAVSTALIKQRVAVRFKRVVTGGDTYLEPWFWLTPE